ncbi:MAG: hypothetical protein RJQ04_03125 [Longimicrobiales bacterium]
MAREWLERDDLSVYVVAGVPKSFNKQLKSMLQKKQGDDVESLRLDEDLSEWVLARVRGEKRASSKRSPASKALWRAFRALAAARYHLRGDEEMDEEIRALRDQVEQLWFKYSPLHRSDDEEE